MEEKSNISLSLDKSVKELMKKEAESLGISVSSFVNIYMRVCLSNEADAMVKNFGKLLTRTAVDVSVDKKKAP